jgi:hypothetical protein
MEVMDSLFEKMFLVIKKLLRKYMESRGKEKIKEIQSLFKSR